MAKIIELDFKRKQKALMNKEKPKELTDIGEEIDGSELNYFRCECSNYVFNTFRIFLETKDGRLIPQEKQVCANPRCGKELKINWDKLT